MRDVLVEAYLFNHIGADTDSTLCLKGSENVAIVVIIPGVDMDAVKADKASQTFEDDTIPVAPAVVPAGNELDGRVGPEHDLSALAGFFDVVGGIERTDLPATVHFVAEPPVFDVEWFGIAVLTAEIGPVGVTGTVAVFNPALGFVLGASTEVEADIWLGTEYTAVLDKLGGAKAVWFFGMPGKLHTSRTAVTRADAVLPVIAAGEITTRPAQNGEEKRPKSFKHVSAQTSFIAQR